MRFFTGQGSEQIGPMLARRKGAILPAMATTAATMLMHLQNPGHVCV
jgi:hypothetical protein